MSTSIQPNAPFRADIVGSFLRPQAVKDARAAYAAGTLDAAGLKAVEDEAIRDLVDKQKSAGLQVITDGEFRRSYWHLDFMWGLNGIERRTSRTGYMFHDEETTADTAVNTAETSANIARFFISASSTVSPTDTAISIQGQTEVKMMSFSGNIFSPLFSEFFV